MRAARWGCRAGAATALALVLVVPAAAAIAPALNKPPMGWMSWGRFGCNVDEALVRQTADALIASGMRRAGYRYVVVDDCWMARERAAEGSLTPDPAKFPNGMRAVAEYLHQRDLKFGLYVDAGAKTCQRYPGSYGRAQQDMSTLAGWGVDYVKADWCYPPAPARQVYPTFRDAIRGTGRSMVLSIATLGREQPWTWGRGVGQLWRTTGDMGDSWTTMVKIAARNGSLRRYAGAGGWNDPDELEVGNGGMTTTEYRTHFSLWSIMAAPLLAGTDVRNMSRPIRAILTNREAIAIDQDPLGVPGARHRITATRDVWLKPLAGGERALLIVNRGGEARTIRVPARLLRASRGARFRLRDVWAHRTQDAGAISALVGAHDVAMYRVGVLPSARPRSRG